MRTVHHPDQLLRKEDADHHSTNRERSRECGSALHQSRGHRASIEVAQKPRRDGRQESRKEDRYHREHEREKRVVCHLLESLRSLLSKEIFTDPADAFVHTVR